MKGPDTRILATGGASLNKAILQVRIFLFLQTKGHINSRLSLFEYLSLAAMNFNTAYIY